MGMQYYSQYGQDQFLFEHYFYRRRGGFFVDIGANDGITHSSTLAFERFLDWQGICIEPSPEAFAKLRSKRTAICLNCSVASGEDGDRVPANATQAGCVPVRRLDRILTEHEVQHVDFCVVECAGAELMALRTIDFSAAKIDVLEVQNKNANPVIRKFLDGAGFELVARLGDCNDIYVRRGLERRARTTVICAVWSKEPNREMLLDGHMANLDGQNCKCERVYIFDSGISPPSELKGTSIIVNRPLTIFQAWNLAVGAVDTTYVMNLNLDDRLAPNAITELESAADRRSAILVGADWRVCYTQKETDAVRPCEPTDSVPFVSGWPPRPGTLTRLGSGTADRPTYGPALLWRLDVTLHHPRIPWRFADGTPIRTIGDSIWTSLLQADDAEHCVKLPLIIGNYHSRPAAQAEFRHSGQWELEQIARLGFNSL